MIANLGSRLVDLAAVLGLLACTLGLWGVFLADRPSVLSRALRPHVRLVVWLGALGLLVGSWAAVQAVSSRVTPLPVLGGVVVVIATVAGAVALTGPVGRPTRALVAAAVVLTLLGVLFSARLGTAPSPWISLAALLAFAFFAQSSVVQQLERRVVHRTAGFAALACLALPLVLGGRVRDAFVAVTLPVIGSVQTQELGRILLVVWLAGALARRRVGFQTRERRFARIPLPDVRFALVSLMPAVVGILLGVLSNDYGPALVLAVVATVMLAVAGARPVYFVTAAVGGALASVAVVLTVDKVALRLEAVTRPLGEDGALTQVGTGLVAIAHGDVFGLGLGLGLPLAIPAVRTDLLVAGLGQELGALGMVCVVLLLLLVGTGCFDAARNARKDTQIMLAAGIGALLLVQSLLVFGGVLGLLPLTGMPVPFISSSGSSLVSSAMALGLVVSVSRSSVPGSGATPSGAPPALRRRLTLATAGVIAMSVLMGAASVRAAVLPGDDVVEARARDAMSARMLMLDRGQLRTRDGKVLARTEPADPDQPLRLDNALRRYPEGAAYSALVGYASVLGTASGLEQKLADDLACRDPERLTGHGCPSIELTLDSRVQAVATEAMEGRTGAVIAVDLDSGDVVAYGSWPALDPNAYGDPTQAPPADDVEPDRVTGAVTFPGSVAKLAVGLAGLEQDVDLLAEPLAAYYVDGGRITSFTGAPCGATGVADALAVSCNTEFAHIGAELGAAGLADGTRDLLNQQSSLGGQDILPSRLVGGDASLFLAAAGGIGMGDAQVTPLAISQLTALIARDGKPLTYHLVDGIDEENSADRVDADLVEVIQEGMREAVTSGTARAVPELAALEAAAKTGTADYAPGLNNAWLTGYAPYDDPRFAVTVVLQPGEDQVSGLQGGRDAGPIAAAVLAACFSWAE
ncbi:FtsW/RodA/SpoVE family cell cycle protein [Nocardioides zhouii]|uniref:Uncharacterized protein n=1 Tax=Nocardioides zhouii TaxID=1168729 RepID=A0A4Q2SKQ4_9ACTN|nr:FtsW/RodA/SpoVE family cell cycle protein [Nocardioides zhouii]RYC05733.1 hypothetical protein EUA94_17690 [Nocardioides zhouii]